MLTILTDLSKLLHIGAIQYIGVEEICCDSGAIAAEMVHNPRSVTDDTCWVRASSGRFLVCESLVETEDFPCSIRWRSESQGGIDNF